MAERKPTNTVTPVGDAISIELMDYDTRRDELVISGLCELDSVALRAGSSTTHLDCSDGRFEARIAMQKSRFDIAFFSEDSGRIRILFTSPMSKLYTHLTYWHIAAHIAHSDGASIRFNRYNVLEHTYREFLTFIQILLAGRLKTAVLRVLYVITKPLFARKNIWLFMDKLQTAGDNAEYVYRYALQQEDDAAKYYILAQDSPDAERFRQEGMPFTPYASIKHRLLFLNSNLVFFTHNNVPNYNCFSPDNEMFFRGLFNYDVMYIQHGLTVQDMAWMLRRQLDNIKQYFIASKFEHDNLMQPSYDYRSSQLVHSGLARYDTLINDDKRRILITLTWRKYLEASSLFDSPNIDRPADAYHEILDSLINHPRLIKQARNHDYDIVLLLHPLASHRLDKYSSTSDRVQVVASTDSLAYRDLLTSSSLMVTDYSGVQFDFAYMYKPIVYFHPPELPPSYEESVYKYEKHALGDITTEIDDLVETICEYMENDCKIKPKYKKRIDSFFYHHDFDNCKRIYDRALAWQRESR